MVLFALPLNFDFWLMTLRALDDGGKSTAAGIAHEMPAREGGKR